MLGAIFFVLGLSSYASAQDCHVDTEAFTYPADGILQVNISAISLDLTVNVIPNGYTEEFSFTVTTYTESDALSADDMVSSALKAGDDSVYEVGISESGYVCPDYGYTNSDQTSFTGGGYEIGDKITVICDSGYRSVPDSGGAPVVTFDATCTYSPSLIYWDHTAGCEVNIKNSFL